MPPDNCLPDNCSLDNCPPGNCHQDNCPPKNGFPGNCPQIISPWASGAQTIAPQNISILIITPK